MLKERNRLKKEKEFKTVLREGKGYKSRSLLLKVLEKKEGEPRFGFVVSKKISNKAVRRNKLKRQLREAVRPFLPEMKKVDAAIIAFPQAGEKNFEELKKEIGGLLQRAEIVD